MFTFDPKTEEEIQASNLVEAGVYDFEVAKSTRKVSKSGNQMCEINLRVWDKEGKVHFLFDYLVFTSANLNIRKIKHFCDTVGLEEEYKKGEIPEELVGYSGKVEITIQEEQPNPSGGWYAPKNVVVDYIKSEKNDIKPATQNNDFIEDELPF